MLANTANSAIHPLGIDKWVVSCYAYTRGSTIWGMLTKLKADMVSFVGNTVWSVSECCDALSACGAIQLSALTNLYDWIVVQYVSAARQDSTAINIDWSLSLINYAELSILFQTDNSLSPRNLPCWTLECQIDINLIIFCRPAQSYLLQKNKTYKSPHLRYKNIFMFEMLLVY